MRISAGGAVLASVLALASFSISSCSPKAEAPEAPPAFSLSAAERANGVLPPQTVKVTSKDGYTADVTLTPSWRVSGGQFSVTWYAGLSQTKRFFTLANEAGETKPEWLTNPEQGVRGVRIAFDGGPLLADKPQTTRSAFTVPAGAKAVTKVEVDYGPPDSPVTAAWK